MTKAARPTNLQALRDSGWKTRSVKQELQTNFTRMLQEGEELFPGIVGYENTVIPEINIALLAGHDMLFLGEKGQAKSRLMRSLVRFLDAELPYLAIPGSPIHEDPEKPITRAGRELVANTPPEQVPIAWWPRKERYAERLSPGTKFADVIGEIDPAKLATGTSMSAEEALHFGLIPRMHRGIFAMNEIPELDELVQVGLFNILEERDVQIRGYPVQFDIDVLVLFSANPATYNRSGKVIPQLKDRIGSMIQTHYPTDRSTGIEIMQQEAGVELDGPFPVQVPFFMLELVEQISRSARKSKYVDHASGVSARLSIANYRTMVASARQRGIRLGEKPAVPRVSDLGHLYASSLGKLELDLMAGTQMSEKQVLDAILADALKTVFDEYVDTKDVAEIVSAFERGVKIEVGDMLPSSHYVERLKRVPKAWEKAFEVNNASNDAVRASAVEFVLAGLYAADRILAGRNMGGSAMRSSEHSALGGVIHTYQKYNPAEFPSPTAEQPDLVSPAMEHMLMYGSTRELTEEELARAVHLDPSQIANLGPSIDALKAILEERKRKILQTYETDGVQKAANKNFVDRSKQVKPPASLQKRLQRAVAEEQIYDLEHLWYSSGDERGQFARDLLQLIERLGEKYQVDELASKYEFTGRQSMTVPEALETKRELEAIDKLLQQLDEAMKTAEIGLIDMEELSRFAEPGDVEQLSALQQQIQNYMRELAERQGIEEGKRGGFQLTPKAYRLFQNKLLQTIFEEMQESRTGRHENVIGEGAVETQAVKAYEFGDSVANMDIPQSLVNAMLRNGPGLPIRMGGEDIVVHKTRNNPKCATVAVLDMSGSMGYSGLYIDVKRMGLALDGLIRKEFPGDYLQFVEMYSFGKVRSSSEIAAPMPKPVTIRNSVVHLKCDMSKPEASEFRVPPHFTNIQHGLRLARQLLVRRDTPNRQIVLITDGLPTAHFEEEVLYLLYPPDPRTEAATLREGLLCARDGITINIFLLSNWNQTADDVRFAYRLAESTKGRVVFVGGKELDRYVVWDYLARRKRIIA